MKLKPVEQAPKPAYPAILWRAGARRCRRGVTAAVIAFLVGVGGCGGEQIEPDAGLDVADSDELDAESMDDGGQRGDGGGGDGDGDADAVGRDDSLRRAFGMPLALGLDPSERAPAAPRQPTAPQGPNPSVPVPASPYPLTPTPVMPLVLPWPGPLAPPTPKPPFVGPYKPTIPRTAGVPPAPVRLAGRRSHSHLP